MVRAQVDGADEFSRRIVLNIERFRDNPEQTNRTKKVVLTNRDLAKAAGLSENYFYIRMRYEKPFNVNDITALAKALGVTPDDLTAVPTEDPILRLDGPELARRLRQLASAPVQGADEFRAAALAKSLEDRGIAFTAERWSSLTEETAPVRIAESLMVAIAEFFGVDPLYLVNFHHVEVTERTEAELALESALHKAGAKSVSARSLGEMSPSALREVAKSIKDITKRN